MSSLGNLDLCRLCLVKDRVSVPIFEGEGDVRQIFLKITACLPVKVNREDKLPKKICDDCVYKVELCYQFWHTTANAEKQLLQWLGEVNMEDKQGYNVLNPNGMKEQNNENRLDGTVMQQVSEHQNNMNMGMMDNMGLSMPIMISSNAQQQITSVPMDNSGSSVQNVQPVAGPSTQTTHDQITQNQTDTPTQQEEEEESSEEEENSDDECDGDEGLPIKEESEEDPNNSRTIEPTTFVNVSLACDEAGPSGLQQQKIADMPEMVMSQTADVDPKTGDYMGGPKYEGKENLEDKVVIVTGANSGIGKAVTTELAKRKAKVIMACRDMEKCETERRSIVLDTKNKYVYCRKCDLASQESIRKFVTQFKKEYGKLHILINNAGVMRCPKSHTKDGIEMQLGVNYMGPFLLTNLLLDVLQASAPSRIVNLASDAYRTAEINVKDLNWENDYDAGGAYAQSKLAMMLFTRELANRLKGTDVTVNAVHPGIVDTNITRHMFVYTNYFTRFLLYPFAWPFIKAPLQAAQTVLHAALDPSLTNVSGCYLANSEIKELTEEAKDDDLAKWLWKVGEKWTKLNVA